MATRTKMPRSRTSSPAESTPIEGKVLLSKQVRDFLVEYFITEGFTPGDRLPSEEEIAALGNVGRSTAREALKLLEQEGLVTVRRGQGRYLSSLSALSVERPISRFEPQSEMLAELGFEFATLTLSAVEGLPTEAECNALEIPKTEMVIRVERLRTAHDEPLIYSVCTIPRWCMDGPIKHINWAGSLNALLSAQGYTPDSSSARMKAVLLPALVAKKYSLNPREPWLLIAETVVTAAGQRILYAEDYHRGSSFAFNVLRRP